MEQNIHKIVQISEMVRGSSDEQFLIEKILGLPESSVRF